MSDFKRPWGVLDFVGSILLGIMLFVLFIALGLALLNRIYQVEEGAVEWGYQAAVFVIWCLICFCSWFSEAVARDSRRS